MSLQPRGKVRTKEINVGEVGLEAINQGRVEVEKVGQQRRWRRGSWRRERKSTACRGLEACRKWSSRQGDTQIHPCTGLHGVTGDLREGAGRREPEWAVHWAHEPAGSFVKGSVSGAGLGAGKVQFLPVGMTQEREEDFKIKAPW